LINNVQGLKAVLGAKEYKEMSKTQLGLIIEISQHVNGLKASAEGIVIEQGKVNHNNTEKMAEIYCHKIKPLMDAARDAADTLEQIIDDNTWPIPKMRELLFTC
jgi:glutamine synthetase